MIVRLVGVPLFMDMTHLNETENGISIELSRWLALADQLRHPRLIGARRGEQLLHQGLHLEREPRILAIAPDSANLRNVGFETVAGGFLLYAHGPS
jgi:hypothetical protein